MKYLASLLPAVAAASYLMLPAAGVEAPKQERRPDPAMVRLREKLNPESAPWSPAHVYERCAEHLATINKYDRPRIRYFDASGLPSSMLPAGTASMFFGANSAARVSATYVPRPVHDTDNRIYWIDLTWFNWSAQTWENISDEDPYFREPIIPSDSKALEFLKGETNSNPVVRWDWLCFYAFDNTQFLKLGDTFNEKAFYYQLIYSNVEFTRTVVVDGKKTVKKVRGVGPQNAKEFQEAWKVDFKSLEDFPIDQGAMVASGRSGVSYENRVLWRLRTRIGVYWRTFDVLRSVGDQDFVETPFPKKFDAGEHIVQDARGAQFYHLTNGQDVSVDFGDPRVVKDHVSGARVLLTASSCIHCHDNGIIDFKNENRRLADIGASLRAIDPGRAERFNQFYLQDKKMKKLVADDQREYKDFIADCNGLTSSENSTQFNKLRAWYERPVNLAQASREVGCDPQELADALGYQGTKGRLGALALDDTPIPRQTWERGMFQESALLLLTWRKNGRMRDGGKDYPRKR